MIKNIKKQITEYADTTAAIIMIISSLLAIVISNSDLEPWYTTTINTPLALSYGNASISHSFADWVKELLMAIFFLNVTLELKKEFYEGFLTSRKQFILPLIATMGGIIFPAIFYLIINLNYPAHTSGFAIPCATDIAFAICVFNLLAKGFSNAIKIFLLSIAIFDDLGSMVIIALFYNNHLSLIPILIAAIISGLLFVLHYKKVSSFWPYIILGILLWIAFHKGGLHTTMAGVVIGSFIPMYSNSKETISPLKKLNKIIHPWVQFLILPLFAFVASGVTFSHLHFHDLWHPVSLGVICGLFFGKQFGIFASTWLAVTCKVAPLPQESNWFEVYVASCLAGIGFTMSLFIGFLAFEDEMLQDFVKIAILFSSLLTVAYSALVIRIGRQAK